jgi:hypothetical protein
MEYPLLHPVISFTFQRIYRSVLFCFGTESSKVQKLGPRRPGYCPKLDQMPLNFLVTSHQNIGYSTAGNIDTVDVSTFEINK